MPRLCLRCKNGILNEMSMPIGRLVVGALLFKVFAGWDIRLHALGCGLGDDNITVITSIRQQVFSTQALNQGACTRTISLGACAQEDTHGHPMRVHCKMQLAIQPPFVTPMA